MDYMDYRDLKILFEDNHLIAVNKPAGILVQGDETGDTPLSEVVKEYVKHRYNKPGDVFLGTIHRLDRPVSGVILFARTSKALERMNGLFATRDVEKTYWALVNTRPEPLADTLVHYLVKDHEHNITRAYTTAKNMKNEVKPKRAELTYELVAEIGSHYMLEVKPTTGRSHQIRAQLSKVGYPIRGDLKYGSATAFDNASIALHAHSITFVHPVTKESVTIDAPAPKVPLWQEFERTQYD